MEIYKQNGSTWSDEAGTPIPGNRVTKSEKLRENTAYKLATKAKALSGSLAEFKSYMHEACADVVAAIRAENNIKTDGKGNFTWYNFDQSIKVEGNVNEAIRFDSVLIEGAKEKLLHIINENVQAEDFVKGIVIDAFQTTNGKLDTRRVLGLKKHTTRISNKAIRVEWDEAMALIDKSITRPESKTYYRVSVKDEQGEYQGIDLNFSSIKPA